MKVFIILLLVAVAFAAKVEKPVVEEKPINSTVPVPPKETRTGRYLRLVDGNYYDTYDRSVIYRSPYLYNNNYRSVYVDTIPYYNRDYVYTTYY